MKSSISCKIAGRILLIVNALLLTGFAFGLTGILLGAKGSSDLYENFYQVTLPFQPVIISVWFGTAIWGPLLTVLITFLCDRETRKKSLWRFSVVVTLVAGLPSLAFFIIGYLMRGI